MFCPMSLTFLESFPVSHRGAVIPPCSISVTKQEKNSIPRRRRARVQACSASPNDPPADVTTRVVSSIEDFLSNEIDYEDDVVSDETHVVIDSKDVNHLIQQLQLAGEDDLSSLFSADVEKDEQEEEGETKEYSEAKTHTENEFKGQVKDAAVIGNDDEDDAPEFDSEFFNAAERLSDMRQGRPSAVGQTETNLQSPSTEQSSSDSKNSDVQTESPGDEKTSASVQRDIGESTTPLIPYSAATMDVRTQIMHEGADGKRREPQIRYNEQDFDFKPMDYFNTEHTAFMPSWIREMYENNEHTKLQDGSRNLSYNVAGMRRLHDIVERRQSYDVVDSDDGIADCSLADVAEDYHVPVEFIVDALVAIGVQTPIQASQSIRDSMTTDEIKRLLDLLIRHDSTVLAERYSDRTIAELALDYDLDVKVVIQTCEKEGLYIHSDENSHLLISREDRILDILVRGEIRGKPYPPLLDGLE